MVPDEIRTGLTIQEALTCLLGAVRPITETCAAALAEAGGRVLAADVAAPFPVPPFARSAMDGYAVRCEDIAGASEEHPVRLTVTGEQMAGDGEAAVLAPGTAIRIATGAPVPEGCGAVVKQEHTDQGKEAVTIRRSAAQGENICAAGEDIRRGATVLRAGERIARAELGLLASLGISRAEVRRSARVALLSTGSELVRPGSELPPGKVYDSISPMLCASVRAAGLEVSMRELCGDDAGTIKAALRRAAACSDLIVTTGGVSVGKRDLIPAVLAELDAKPLFHRALVKPGSPTMGSVLNGVPVLSLSGNPYAALANFDYYFYPVAAKLMGCAALNPEELDCVAADGYEKAAPVCALLRAKETGGRVRFPVSGHKASVIGNLLGCNCYVVLSPGAVIHPGDTVHIRRMKVI